MSDNPFDQIANLKKQKKKIVFTNGCFDLIHAGHVHYLNAAKKLGDVLVVGLNSDTSVQKLKGPSRPILTQNERKEILSNLRSVDFVIIFDEETPQRLIEKIIPNVLIKGGDWTVDKIVGADIVLQNGGEVVSGPLIEGRSTTAIIQKIKSL